MVTDLNNKRRRRTPFSCSACRRRKVKCDRKKPRCGGCERNKTGDGCVYESPPFWQNEGGGLGETLNFGDQAGSYIQATTVPVGYIQTTQSHSNGQTLPKTKTKDKATLVAQLESLREQVSNVEKLLEGKSSGASDKIELLDKRKETLIFLQKDGRCFNFGICSWHATTRKDPFLLHMVDDFRKLKKSKKLKDALAGKRPRRAVTGQGSDLLERQISLKKQIVSPNYYKFNTDAKDLSGLMSSMVRLMPSQNIVWGNLRHFFKYLVPFYPVIDEKEFLESVQRILSYSEEGKPDLKFSKKTDPILICTLLVIIRMSYLNLLLKSHRLVPLNGDEQTLLACPVEANVISIAHATLEHFKFLRKTGIEILQLLVLLRYYFKNAPEDGDGGDGVDSMVFIGTLINSATAVGVHRDLVARPSTLKIGSSQDQLRFTQKWRKIWWLVVVTDISQSLNLGCLPITDDEECDTSLPIFDPASANVENLRSEQDGIARIRKRVGFHPMLRRLMKLTMSLKICPTVSQLTTEITILSDYLNKNVDPHLKVEGNEFLAAEERMLVMEVGCFILAMEHFVLLHHETQRDTRNFFDMSIKVLGRSLHILKVAMGLFKLLFSKLENFNFPLLSSCSICLGKVTQFFIFALVRIRIIEQKVRYNEIKVDLEKHALLIELSKTLYARLKAITSIFMLLSDTYYSALKAHAQLSFVLDCLKGGDYVIKEDTRSLHNNSFEDLSAGQLRTMLTLIDSVVIDDPKEFAFHNLSVQPLTPFSPETDMFQEPLKKTILDQAGLPTLRPDEARFSESVDSFSSEADILDFLDFFNEDFEAPKFAPEFG
ncbi:unnamed protein product [Kuraishia capsulata CBS 1993]|uniref:Zn(2)-C6 fungal-type domain-containing protein n=1 Tax=Kuraishia capsulata CBS 1993 TaxID=1382522 RepID=W6ML31_9ASCO|nr:uncharacterized protein KUCA_T00003151001 [Kuraishia capsulata CBS 1993]CDK27174.1 unnamed protein product [Kuraishia capsulata CBS 1993]